MKIIPYKVGQKVIIDGYTIMYDKRILTIREVEEAGNVYFYYFDESRESSHKFEHKHIVKLIEDER